MKTIRKFFATLRIFRRLRGLEIIVDYLDNERNHHADRICALEAFIESRKPCSICGHHRYRQETALHRSKVA